MSPLPPDPPQIRVKHCIVCELVRPEFPGKLSILGYFGSLPDVSISLAGIPVTVPFLSFLFVLEGNGNFVLTARFNDTTGVDLLRQPKVASTLELTEGKNHNWGFMTVNVKFSTPGIYAVTLLANDQVAYESALEVRVDPGVSPEVRIQ